MEIKAAVLLILLSLSESHAQKSRQGRDFNPSSGIDFSGCVPDPDTGHCCVEREETVSSLQKDPVLECTHKNIEKCHYTYITQFTPSQEEVCEENFEKLCQITFKQQAYNETVKKCYRPLEKVCNGQGPEECRTVHETACSTKYVEKYPGKFIGDTKCEKIPIEICGAGCVTENGPEECHDKVITSIIDVPEEICDLNPQKTCRFETKLVPKLSPSRECTNVPQEICNLRFSQPKTVKKPLKTKWCLDSTPVPSGDIYDDISPASTGSFSQNELSLPSYKQENAAIKSSSFNTLSSGNSGSFKSSSTGFPQRAFQSSQSSNEFTQDPLFETNESRLNSESSNQRRPGFKYNPLESSQSLPNLPASSSPNLPLFISDPFDFSQSRREFPSSTSSFEPSQQRPVFRQGTFDTNDDSQEEDFSSFDIPFEESFANDQSFSQDNHEFSNTEEDLDPVDEETAVILADNIVPEEVEVFFQESFAPSPPATSNQPKISFFPPNFDGTQESTFINGQAPVASSSFSSSPLKPESAFSSSRPFESTRFEEIPYSSNQISPPRPSFNSINSFTVNQPQPFLFANDENSHSFGPPRGGIEISPFEEGSIPQAGRLFDPRGQEALYEPYGPFYRHEPAQLAYDQRLYPYQSYEDRRPDYYGRLEAYRGF